MPSLPHVDAELFGDDGFLVPIRYVVLHWWSIVIVPLPSMDFFPTVGIYGSYARHHV